MVETRINSIIDEIVILKASLTDLRTSVTTLIDSNQKAEHNDLIIDIEKEKDFINRNVEALNRAISELFEVL